MSIFDELLFVNREKKFLGFQKLLLPSTRQAIMLIEAPQDMGKTWLVGRIQNFCREPDTDVAVAQIDFRNPLQIHEIQDDLSLLRFIRDRLGHSSYFNNLNATINAFTDASLNINSGLGTLRQNIERTFNLDELNNLALDLGVNYENLPGQTLQAKSRELVNYCQRHNLLRNLIERCAELRSQVDWWTGLESLRQEPVVDADASGVDGLVSDNSAPIWADSDMERRRALHQINSAFFECLASLLADKVQVALLFDSYEMAPPEVDRWLRDELLSRLRDGLLNKLVIVITGRKTPDLTELSINELLVQTGLDPFNEEHVREYLEDRRNIAGLDLRTVILTSGGIPGALAMMADHAMSTAADDDDFFSDL